MANILIPNVWVLDTQQSTPVDTMPLYIWLIRWMSPSAVANDQMILADRNGNPIWPSVATGPQWFYDSPVLKRPMLYMNGLMPLTLSSGKVWVYFLRSRPMDDEK